ncbi:MAG: hypothetical protein AVDCRST_MAG12-2206 [uncultured Rubrobacteraceae bacterium]|uniref:Uncharacterized protein n=1 Tax=uncultured Rubrobacteraceae bacterium TaxID=349277 RepID=A0A6J4SJ17_9ACTN|nr:MAG: hypothetical protein AVDCRST_MAG12-2206 [uncultured Rubrobacteraceae bacterium]
MRTTALLLASVALVVRLASGTTLAAMGEFSDTPRPASALGAHRHARRRAEKGLS